MEQLTQRQIEILRSIIQEYTLTGEPVGSQILERKYKLGVSPATIRNEMVELAKKGYLKKSHFSSGRVPSAVGFRFYIKHLMKEKELSTADEVAYKNSIWDERKETHRLLSQAVRVVAHRTGLLSLATTSFGDVYYSGIANLLNKQEFLNWDLSKSLFEHLDEMPYWEQVLLRLERLEQNIAFMLGAEDFIDPELDSCASILGEFSCPTMRGFIGVFGSKRMDYDVLTPQIRYMSSLIEEIMKDQEKK